MTIRRAPRGAVVFDCDNTLVATLGAWERAYKALFAGCGRVFDPAVHLRGLVGMPLEPLGHALATLLDRHGEHAALSAGMVALLTADEIRPMPDAVELIAALRGSRPLAVASNTPRVIVWHYLAAVGLAQAFDAVLGCDDVAAPKPAPDIYQAACALLGVDPTDAVAVEDCPSGLAAASRAGLFVIRVGETAAPADLAVANLGDPALWRALGLPAAQS
ncbi:HAD family hydrolase [Micromonospora sp. NBC_01813]|uniref:HAD family hydrolase n=1 Tax=Micromonospora sp. NBC_01813 TaxID=2975988 RepID=UPI002DDB8CB3|nr:HAD family phosphatase [Micromonospora sp. NBC_01813]WSA07949.1 HAD family phosphatase [Micromonospora sp. NBC_01813]